MKLSNLFNDCVRVAQGLRKGSARPAREWLKSMTILALLLIVGGGSAWGTAPTLADLSFTTPIVDEDFNSLSVVSNNATAAVSKTNWTAYGVLNCIYNNNTGNTYQINNTKATTGLGTKCLYLTVNSSKNSGTIMHITTETWGTKGAFRVKTTKTSRGYMGFYAETSGTIYAKANSSVYVKNLSGTITINDGSSSGVWQEAGTYTTDSIDICVIYNNTNSSASYGNSISLGSKTAHMYINGSAVMNAAGTAPKDFTIPGISLVSFRLASNFTTNNTAAYDDLQIWNALPTAAVSCSYSVTINKGTQTNCTFTLSKSGSQYSCDGVATTVSITPTSGYGSPSVTQSGASAAPSITGSGNSQTVTYAANTTGTSVINVSCSANNYVISLDNQGADSGKEGTTSVTATFNSNSNLTSAIIKPTKTGWTFGGYYTSPSGTGTQLVDADGNWLASKTGYTDASKNWIYTDGPTLFAKWTCTVTWSVNKLTNVYSAQTVTYNASGCKVASIPGPPNPASYCGDKFVGWTSDENYVHGTSNLFTTVAGSPELKTVGNTTFYAVFADYDE